jgi:hypothetical protein
MGSQIGPYTVLSKLGEGGMGEVYRAQETRLRREVAIKVLPSLVATDRERLMRFEREAQTLAGLNHPHIATVLGLEDVAGGTRALVMELVAGDDLTATLARGPLAWRDALAIARSRGFATSVRRASRLTPCSASALRKRVRVPEHHRGERQHQPRRQETPDGAGAPGRTTPEARVELARICLAVASGT